MTRDEAIKKAESGWWIGLSSAHIVAFQLFEPRICMPIRLFQEALEKELGRGVMTHEFQFMDDLRAEFLKKARLQKETSK